MDFVLREIINWPIRPIPRRDLYAENYGMRTLEINLLRICFMIHQKFFLLIHLGSSVKFKSPMSNSVRMGFPIETGFSLNFRLEVQNLILGLWELIKKSFLVILLPNALYLMQ